MQYHTFLIFNLLTDVSLYCYNCRCQAIEMNCEDGHEYRLLNKKQNICTTRVGAIRIYEYTYTKMDTGSLRDVTLLRG